MRHEHDRRPTASRSGRLAAVLLGMLLLLTAPVPSLAQQEKCTCTHLDAIRAQKKNTQAMYDYSRKLTTDLLSKEFDILTDDQLTKEQKTAKIKELTATSEQATKEATDTLIRFDNDTCEPNPEDLKKRKAAAPCLEAGLIAEHHEDYHHDVCVIRRKRQGPRRTTWMIHPMMLEALSHGLPSADNDEEAEAYALEVTELQALIERLTADLRYVLILKSVAHMDWKIPMGPVGNAAQYGSTARIPLEVEDGPTPQRVSGRATRIFEGRIIGGVCQYTGMPMNIPIAVEGTLEAGRFKLKIDKDGQQVPGFGVACPWGAGMAMPSPAPPPPLPPGLDIEARDGARFVYDYSAAATMVSAVGRLSGDAVLAIETVCKPDE